VCKSQYRKEVWRVMHNSDSPDKKTAAIRLYLDESGGEDPGTPHAVIGGMLIESSKFMPFEDAWDCMLEAHGIQPPLHMKDFGRPHGRLAEISDCCRRELFMEVAELINSQKLFSVAAMLSNDEYKEHFPQEARDKFSVYGMCFNLIVMLNHRLAQHMEYSGRVPVILDTGNPHANHVREAHAAMIEDQKKRFLHLGSLTFDDDRDFGILQAADVIAWGVRKSATGKPLPYPFAPISAILSQAARHFEHSWEVGWLKEVGAALLRLSAETEGV
jgi:hypothetical protein